MPRTTRPKRAQLRCSRAARADQHRHHADHDHRALVALVVALLFASTFAPMNLATPVAVLFVLSMVSLVVALVAFLLEVRIAIAVLRIGSW